MRSNRWVIGRRGLLDDQRADRVAPRRDQGSQRVEAGRFQPFLGPGSQVATGAGLDVAEELFERGIRVLPFLDICLLYTSDAADE